MPRPSKGKGDNKMATVGEQEHMAVVESSIREIARQLRIMNRLEEFRLRKEYSSAENDPIITEIMGDEE